MWKSGVRIHLKRKEDKFMSVAIICAYLLFAVTALLTIIGISRFLFCDDSKLMFPLILTVFATFCVLIISNSELLVEAFLTILVIGFFLFVTANIFLLLVTLFRNLV